MADRREVLSGVTALRLLIEGVNDGVLDAGPGSPTTERMLEHVRALGLRLEELEPGSRAGGAAVRPVAIPPLLRHGHTAMSERAARKGISLRLESPPALPLVRCQAQQISRAVVTLIGDAIRLTPSGGTVTLRALSQAEGLEVRVDDTAAGLPSSVRDRLLAYPRRGGAAELGLPLARAIVEAHGGRLWVASASTGGSVRFRLPQAGPLTPS